MEYNELTTKEVRELEMYIDDLEALYDLANEELLSSYGFVDWPDGIELNNVREEDIEQFMEWYDEI